MVIDAKRFGALGSADDLADATNVKLLLNVENAEKK